MRQQALPRRIQDQATKQITERGYPVAEIGNGLAYSSSSIWNEYSILEGYR